MGLLVGAGRNHLVELVGFKCFVILVHNLLDLGNREVHLLAELFNRIGLAIGVVQGIKLRNDAVQHRAVAVNDHPGVVVQSLLRRRTGLNDVRVVFIHVTHARSVHLHAVAGIENIGGVHVGFPKDRAGVELIHVHKLREQRSRERNVFARGVAGTVKHHACGPAADVLVNEAGVGGKAARCNQNAAA